MGQIGLSLASRSLRPHGWRGKRTISAGPVRRPDPAGGPGSPNHAISEPAAPVVFVIVSMLRRMRDGFENVGRAQVVGAQLAEFFEM
jgi:hypothetical protein